MQLIKQTTSFYSVAEFTIATVLCRFNHEFNHTHLLTRFQSSQQLSANDCPQ